MNLMLLGGPGSGKGTQAANIVEDYKLAHISTGDMLREAVAAGTELGKKAQEYMSAGKLVPDEFIVSLVEERLHKPDCEAGFMLDGFPRTSEQAEALNIVLDKVGKEIDFVVFIDVEDDEIVRRICSRRTCSDCGYIGSDKDAVCPKCGGEMTQRADDNEQTVRTRLAVYEEQTAPLIDYAKERGLLVTVDGNQGPDKVYEDIKNQL
ncbi:MAG: adenylate kinase [Eggerthellaceae bacterium]|nr:adenylate kinase [Eggerthellaceae bacterium]